MGKCTPFGANLILFCLFAGIFSFAFIRVHLRVQTTLIGYEIGKLKAQEAQLLESRSQLRMVHAKLTTKDHLSLMANKNLGQKGKPTSLAVH